MNLLEEILSLINEAHGFENAKFSENIDTIIVQIKWAKVYIKSKDRETILALPPYHDDMDCRKFLNSLEDAFKADVTYSSGTIMLDNSIAWLEKTEKAEQWEHHIVPKFS